jgi:hypothetical protein
MKNLLLLLLFASFTLTSCLKDKVEPELIICLTEPTFIGKWEQISFSENQFNNKDEKIKERIIEFKEDNEKAIKIEFLEPEREDSEESDNGYIAKGKYIAKVYDEETQKVINIVDIYKLLEAYANTQLPIIELYGNKGSIRYFPKIQQTNQGVILSLTNIINEGEEKILTETILTFKAKS